MSPSSLQLDLKTYVNHHENLHSRYAAFTSKPKTDQTEIYLDACNRPPQRNQNILETQHSHQPDRHSGRFRRTQNRLKLERASEIMNEQLSSGGIG
ncbi:hypothetical protein ACTXT7_014506 [Hymenolepis weldensis]